MRKLAGPLELAIYAFDTSSTNDLNSSMVNMRRSLTDLTLTFSTMTFT